MYYVIYVFLIFFIYAVLGYFCEVFGIFINSHKINFSRGYLIGPYLPIFGFGALIITYYLSKYSNDLVALFILGSFFCCLLEYLTSFFLEKIFKLRWWDYSEKKFNLNGRISLETGIYFGVASILIVRVVNPINFKIFNLLSHKLLIIISIILFIIIFIDFIISTYTICKLNIDSSKLSNKDATKEIREKVKESLKKHRFFNNRLFKAFPNITKSNYNLEKIKEFSWRKTK